MVRPKFLKNEIDVFVILMLLLVSIIFGAFSVSCSSTPKSKKTCVYDKHNIPVCYVTDPYGEMILDVHSDEVEYDDIDRD